MKGIIADAERGALVPELRLEITSLHLKLEERDVALRKGSLRELDLKEQLFDERNSLDWGSFFQGIGAGVVLTVVVTLVTIFIVR